MPVQLMLDKGGCVLSTPMERCLALPAPFPHAGLWGHHLPQEEGALVQPEWGTQGLPPQRSREGWL